MRVGPGQSKTEVPMERNSKLQKEPVERHRAAGFTILRRLGATRMGVWVIKHVVSPLDRWLYQRTGGRRVSTGQPLGPLLLLTTTGRRTGRARTTPVYYLRDGDRLVLCNVNPGFERPNPWTLNLRANPMARVQIGPVSGLYQAREASEAELGSLVSAEMPQVVSRAWHVFSQRAPLSILHFRPRWD
jgi:F420H(2)-dependent quinone reductase